MSIRMWLRRDEWELQGKLPSFEKVLLEWKLDLICNHDHWSESTAAKYVAHILSGSPPDKVVEAFEKWLESNGYEEYL